MGRAANSVEELLSSFDIVERAALTTDDGYSGASIERVIARDGTSYVLKRMAIEHDWIMRATNDHRCRAAAIWVEGLLERAPTQIDHAIVGAAQDGDGWALFMRDVGASMLPPAGIVARRSWERIFVAAAALHAAFWREDLPSFLCSIDDRLTALGPEVGVTEVGEGSPAPPELGKGWQILAETVPADVAEPTIAIASGEGPPLAAALREVGSTFLHADLKFGNLGLGDDRVVMLDWQVCADGPPVLDLAWFIAINATRCEGTREDLIDGFREALARALGSRFDPGAWERSLDLGLLAGFAQLAWNKAHDAVLAEDPADRAREAADLAWWVDRARAGLERLG